MEEKSINDVINDFIYENSLCVTNPRNTYETMSVIPTEKVSELLEKMFKALTNEV